MFIRPRAAVTSAPPRVSPDVAMKTFERTFKGKGIVSVRATRKGNVPVRATKHYMFQSRQ